MCKAQITVVEDEAIVAKDVRHKPKSLGYSVARSGEEAVA